MPPGDNTGSCNFCRIKWNEISNGTLDLKLESEKSSPSHPQLQIHSFGSY